MRKESYFYIVKDNMRFQFNYWLDGAIHNLNVSLQILRRKCVHIYISWVMCDWIQRFPLAWTSF